MDLSKGQQRVVHAVFSQGLPPLAAVLLGTLATSSPWNPCSLLGPQLLALVGWPTGMSFTSKAQSYSKPRWTLNSP